LNDEDLVSGDPADISIFLPYPRDVPRGDRVVMAPNSNSVFYPISKSWNLSSFGIVYFMYEVEFLPLPKKANGWTLKYTYTSNEALKKIHFPPYDATG